VVQAYERAASGQSPRQILDATIVGGLASKDMRRILRNDVYRGVICSTLTDGIEVAAAFPGIVSSELWDRVQLRLRGGKSEIVSRLTDFPGRGVLHCEQGHRMTASYSRGRSARYGYYHCAKCGMRAKAAPVDAAILALLADAYVKAMPVIAVWRDSLAHAAQAMRAEGDQSAAQIAREITLQERRATRLMDLYLAEGIEVDAYRAGNQEIQQRLTQLRCAKHDAELAELEAETLIASSEALLSDLPALYESLTPASRPGLLLQVFGELVCLPNGEVKLSNRCKSGIMNALTDGAHSASASGAPGVREIEPLAAMREALAAVKAMGRAA
jgi:hypothetical protein